MRRCIQLAELGKGHVAPNPMVGCVIVHQDQIIAEGYHQKFGEAHAEVNAINNVPTEIPLEECTAYVSLEPCAHYGKTPPCANLLVEKGIKKVVIGAFDTHSKVAGKGIQILEEAGIEVTIGVLEETCRIQNKHFFTYQEQERPFVLLKWAQTQAGFMDNDSGVQGEVSWISGPEVKTLVHELRSEYQAILVGKHTVLNDNPSLTVRKVSGNNPIRVILDTNIELSEDYSAFNDEAPTIIINKLRSEELTGIKYIQVDAMTPDAILKSLYKEGIQSVLIEGGSATLQSFIEAELWDEAYVISGSTEFKSGTKAPEIQGQLVESKQIMNDTIHVYRRTC